jgi:3-methyladenine DNA glycosylase/8-oxoguanine DNA glycosylase
MTAELSPDETSCTVRTRSVPAGFNLCATIAPTAWSRGRWPDHDWIAGSYIWAGRESGQLRHRIVRQTCSNQLEIHGDADQDLDDLWISQNLGTSQKLPEFSDPIVRDLRVKLSGLYLSSAGSLFQGIIDCIVGQSISVAAAATMQRRLYALFSEGMEIGSRTYYPAPHPYQLAETPVALIRSVGVTWRRAEAIVAAGKARLSGEIPDDKSARDNPDFTRMALMALPLVGRWTAESALLWGIGTIDAFPSGDIALLRAVRDQYDFPAATLNDLEKISDKWSPARGYASRLLWTSMLGIAPDDPFDCT